MVGGKPILDVEGVMKETKNGGGRELQVRIFSQCVK